MGMFQNWVEIKFSPFQGGASLCRGRGHPLFLSYHCGNFARYGAVSVMLHCNERGRNIVHENVSGLGG